MLPYSNLTNLLLVAFGGALGAMLRHGCNLWFASRHSAGLPASTLTVNVIGCFFAGLVLIWLDTRGAHAPAWRNFLMVGVLGALTTFSALGLELFQLLKAERLLIAGFTLGAHVIAGVAAVGLGVWLGRIHWLGDKMG